MTFSEEPSKTIDVAASAATSVIEKGILGALLIIAVIGIVFLIRRLLHIQDQRVEDQVRANEVMERARDKTAAIMEHFSKASNDIDMALDRFADVQSDTAKRFADVQSDTVKAVSELRAAVTSLQNMVDSVIRDAVRSRRAASETPTSSSSSSRHETRPGEYEVVKGEERRR